MKRALGKKVWAVAEGYIPGWSNGASGRFESHETLCLLNAGGETARVELTLYFNDRDPAGPYRLEVPPCRTLHQRINDLKDPETIPREKDFAMVVESSVPIVVQHTRLDSRQSESALLSTIAYFQEGA